VDKRLENWREEMRKYTSNDDELVLLEHGPKSLAQSWRLQALKHRYMRIMGIDE